MAVMDQYQYTPVHTLEKAKELREIPFERSKDGDQQQQGVDGLEQIPAWITVGYCARVHWLDGTSHCADLHMVVVHYTAWIQYCIGFPAGEHQDNFNTRCLARGVVLYLGYGVCLINGMT